METSFLMRADLEFLISVCSAFRNENERSSQLIIVQMSIKWRVFVIEKADLSYIKVI